MSLGLGTSVPISFGEEKINTILIVYLLDSCHLGVVNMPQMRYLGVSVCPCKSTGGTKSKVFLKSGGK